MQYIIDFTLEDLKNNSKFKIFHSNRQAEAVYEMLLSFDKFTKIACSYLEELEIVEIFYEHIPTTGWNNITEYLMTVKLI